MAEAAAKRSIASSEMAAAAVVVVAVVVVVVVVAVAVAVVVVAKRWREFLAGVRVMQRPATTTLIEAATHLTRQLDSHARPR